MENSKTMFEFVLITMVALLMLVSFYLGMAIGSKRASVEYFEHHVVEVRR